MSRVDALAWPVMMQTAVRMGIAPAAFWRLSVKEWRSLTEGPALATPLSRDDFERMAEAWPDD